MTWKHIKEAGNLAYGMVQADRLIAKLQPDLVFSKGGSVSVPIILAAVRRGIPVVAHESDAAPGMANRFIARYASKIFTAFPAEAYAQIPSQKLMYVGQPVRQEFYHPDMAAEVLVAGKVVGNMGLPVVTVIGGSGGARRINYLVQEQWERILSRVQLVHICGPHDLTDLLKAAESLPKDLRERLILTDFVTEYIAELFWKSEVMISRSGGTIAELAAARRPTILIPLSTSAQNHQWKNAQILAGLKAAIVLDETKVTSQELTERLFSLLDDKKAREQLSKAIADFARPDAARTMATYLLDTVYGRKS